MHSGVGRTRKIHDHDIEKEPVEIPESGANAGRQKQRGCSKMAKELLKMVLESGGNSCSERRLKGKTVFSGNRQAKKRRNYQKQQQIY